MPLKNTWIENNKFLLAIAFIVALLVYGVELGNFTLSIDEEVAAYEAASWRVWLSQGRWGMSVLLNLFPNFTYIPYLATLIFSALLALSSVYFARQFFSDVGEAAVFVVIFVASPVWLHIGEFNTLSWGIGIALLACACAVRLFRQEKIGSSILALVLAGFAVSVYQAFAGFYAMALLMLAMKDWRRQMLASNDEPGFTRMSMPLLRIGVNVLLAIVFYTLVQKIAMRIAGIQISHIGMFVRTADYLANPVATFLGAFHKIFRIVSGTDASYVGWGWAILILPWLGCLAWLKSIAGLRSKPKLLLVYVLATLLLLVLTFSLVLLAAGSLPLRAVIGFPLLCAVSAALGFRMLGKWPILRVSVLVYSTVICIWISSFLFGLDALARDRDQVMATKISAEISRVAPAHLNVVQVVFVGEWAHQPVHGVREVEIFGTSFFQQDGGNRFRIAMYMQLMGITNLETRPVTAIRANLPEIERMPSWPAAGSVSQINNIVVVKLSALSQSQKAELGLP